MRKYGIYAFLFFAHLIIVFTEAYRRAQPSMVAGGKVTIFFSEMSDRINLGNIKHVLMRRVLLAGNSLTSVIVIGGSTERRSH